MTFPLGESPSFRAGRMSTLWLNDRLFLLKLFASKPVDPSEYRRLFMSPHPFEGKIT